MGKSNFAFKKVMPLTGGTAYFVSLPYKNPYAVANDLLTDIVAAGGTVVAVYGWDGSGWNNHWQGGGFGQHNFTITAGDAFQLGNASTISWAVVGAHDPDLVLSFVTATPRFISIPYNTSLSDAAHLWNSMTAAGATGLEVDRYNGATFDAYTGGGRGNVNFSIGVASEQDGIETLSGSDFSWKPEVY